MWSNGLFWLLRSRCSSSLGLVVGAARGAAGWPPGGMQLVFRMLAVAAVAASGFAVLFALAPNVPVAFFADAGIEASLAVVSPGVLAALSLAIPSAGPLGGVLDRRPVRAAGAGGHPDGRGHR